MLIYLAVMSSYINEIFDKNFLKIVTKLVHNKYLLLKNHKSVLSVKLILIKNQENESLKNHHKKIFGSRKESEVEDFFAFTNVFKPCDANLLSLLGTF